MRRLYSILLLVFLVACLADIEPAPGCDGRVAVEVICGFSKLEDIVRF